MTRPNTSTISGFPEFSPRAESLRQQWLAVIESQFILHGFQPISTPLAERETNLVAKGGNAKEMYVLRRLHADTNDADSGAALRFDHTVPLGLYVARHLNDIAFPFRRSVIGPVFRGERPQKGRFRQFTQCDIDIIGNGSLSHYHDAEVIATMCDIFTQLDIGPCQIRVNNRKLLLGYLESLGLDPAGQSATLKVIDDREKLPPAQITSAFTELGLSPSQQSQLLAWLDHPVTTSTLPQLANACDSPTYQQGVTELTAVLTALQALGTDPTLYRVDLSIARGLDYYTGTVMETQVLTHPEWGSVCSGGRYADLAEVFTGRALPGVGISIGLTRLLSQYLAAYPLPTDLSPVPTEVLFAPMAEAHIPVALSACQTLRQMGIPCEVYFEDAKLKKKLAYANKLNIPRVAIIGDTEAHSDTLTVKHLQTGEQTTQTVSDLIESFYQVALIPDDTITE